MSVQVYMQTHHIHIKGLVQGVGFRPFVCRIAKQMGLNGTVCNGNDGVHIEFNAADNIAGEFYKRIISHPPVNAVISKHSGKKIKHKEFNSFTIITSSNRAIPDLLITPDLGLCKDCKKEILDKNNRRFRYPFTTCLKCGPRYSIMKSLPYDRENTTMHHLKMCAPCNEEYLDLHNQRQFSQTNTCPECTIPMHLYDTKGKLLSGDSDAILRLLDAALRDGKIAAVKGIGGYLLICDATNAKTIETLRQRKHRPAKPFALLYTDIEMVQKDVTLSSDEMIALQEKISPIVLCRIAGNNNKIALQEIAPGLNRVGIMLPYSALLLLISDKFNKPLIATSGNISGSPIIYQDDEAIKWLSEVADLVLTYDRDIVTPQDDSVIQYTDKGQKIILRRSRGMAPGYFPNPLKVSDECLLAMGSELKSAFALYNKGNLLVSQYLGDQSSLESQKSFEITRNHLQQLFHCTPGKILVDKHPEYYISQTGRTEAIKNDIELIEVQHHKAHFAAVLAENEMLSEKKPVLGVIWDGSGYGDDKQIWGSEFFICQENDFHRIVHLDYFPQLVGDKMNKEPRLSALSLLTKLPVQQQQLVRNYFSKKEWDFYQQLIKQPVKLFTGSMGRFLDGIAALLGVCTVNTFEGEAAMRLEAIAKGSFEKQGSVYSLPFENGVLNWRPFILEMLDEYDRKENSAAIAWKVFLSLAKSISEISNVFKIDKIAFSGGVFQNALLSDLVQEEMKNKQLYFHRQLSPNDECIGFGQLAYYFMQKPARYNPVKQMAVEAFNY